MSIRSILAVAALAATTAACASVNAPSYGPPPSSAYSAEAFGWSTLQGQAAIDGRVTFQRDGVAYGCTGSVALTPDTPYTRARFRTLYGSIESAALPEAVVRARTVADPNADYRAYVRAGTCADNRFMLNGLPDGGWFIIVPVSAGGERIVLMRRVETRGGRMIAVTL